MNNKRYLKPKTWQIVSKNNEKKTRKKHNVSRIFVYLYMVIKFTISHMGFNIMASLSE